MRTSLETPPVIIRPFRVEDAGCLYEAVMESGEELRKWMTWCGKKYSLRQARAFIRASKSAWTEGEQYNFAIISVKERTFLGSVSLNRRCRIHDHANIGYWVRKSGAGQGAATAAVKLVADFGLKELGLNRLEILVPEGNAASGRVAQKAGAKQEGVLRKRLMLRGKCHDAALFSLVRVDVACADREGKGQPTKKKAKR